MVDREGVGRVLDTVGREFEGYQVSVGWVWGSRSSMIASFLWGFDVISESWVWLLMGVF